VGLGAAEITGVLRRSTVFNHSPSIKQHEIDPDEILRENEEITGKSRVRELGK
jgi:hypothetical protein